MVQTTYNQPFDMITPPRHYVDEDDPVPSTSAPNELTHVPNIQNLIDSIALKFALYLHSQPNFTRKDVFNIQNFISYQILEKICNLIEEKLPHCQCQHKSEVFQILYFVKRFFNKVETEYLIKR